MNTCMSCGRVLPLNDLGYCDECEDALWDSFEDYVDSTVGGVVSNESFALAPLGLVN